MEYLNMLSLQQFIASETYPGMELHQQIVEYMPELAYTPIPHIHVFAGEFIMYERGGKFWVVAWWYPEIGYTSKAQAIASLYSWFCEWAA